MSGEGLSRRDLFKKLLPRGKEELKGGVRSPREIEEGFFQTLYDCDGCVKAAIARLTQEELYPIQCPIHGG
jgi:hypothetical protein